MYVFIKFVEYNREERKRKRSYELIRLFGNVTDQTGVREAIISLGFLSRKNNWLSPLLLRTLGSRLNLAWSRSSKIVAALNSSLSLCSSVYLDLI